MSKFRPKMSSWFSKIMNTKLATHPGILQKRRIRLRYHRIWTRKTWGKRSSSWSRASVNKTIKSLRELILLFNWEIRELGRVLQEIPCHLRGVHPLGRIALRRKTVFLVWELKPEIQMRCQELSKDLKDLRWMLL
jgi:hypothetical protein